MLSGLPSPRSRNSQSVLLPFFNTRSSSLASNARETATPSLNSQTPPPNASTSNQRQSVRTLLLAFRFHRQPLTSADKVPRLSEQVPLSLFYHADEHLLTTLAKLSALPENIDPNSLRFKKHLVKIHRAQRILLDTINLMFCYYPETQRTPRSYFDILPRADQRELSTGFSENILYAAEALAAGFRIRGIDCSNESLRNAARHVCATLEAVRYVFRHRALRNPLPPFDTLFDVMRDFDHAWAQFEWRICFSYFAAGPGGSDWVSRNEHLNPFTNESGLQDINSVKNIEKESLTLLFSETVLDGIKNGYFTSDDVVGYEPFLIMAIPRLAIVNALLRFPDLLPLSSPEVHVRWFNMLPKHRASIFESIDKQLRNLSQEQLVKLEEKLSADESKEVELDESCLTVYRDICSCADKLHAGSHSKEIVQVLKQVFLMHQPPEKPLPELSAPPQSLNSTSDEEVQGATRRKSWWQRLFSK